MEQPPVFSIASNLTLILISNAFCVTWKEHIQCQVSVLSKEPRDKDLSPTLGRQPASLTTPPGTKERTVRASPTNKVQCFCEVTIQIHLLCP